MGSFFFSVEAEVAALIFMDLVPFKPVMAGQSGGEAGHEGSLNCERLFFTCGDVHLRKGTLPQEDTTRRSPTGALRSQIGRGVQEAPDRFAMALHCDREDRRSSNPVLLHNHVLFVSFW